MTKVGNTAILVLGAGGMLGNAIFRLLGQDARYQVTGTLRTASKMSYFASEQYGRVIPNIDVTDDDALAAVLADTAPSVIINCVGIIKQHADAKDPLLALAINAMLPHRLARLCNKSGARLIHISTDCVFSGSAGNYRETDFPDADDLYGRTKYLGETHYQNTLTLRTSIIGHELGTTSSLVDWFLSQKNSAKGYSEAIFSGLPTVEVAKIIGNLIIDKTNIEGLYHLSADPISKKDLLNLISQIYKKPIEIIPDSTIHIDRSLNSDRFRKEIGYTAPSWPELIHEMHQDYLVYAKNFQSGAISPFEDI